MTWPQSSQLACPRCGQIDQVQKVSAVVGAGSTTGIITGAAPGTPVGGVLRGASQAVLGHRLAPPAEPVFKSAWECLTVGLMILGILSLLGAIVFAIFDGVYWLLIAFHHIFILLIILGFAVICGAVGCASIIATFRRYGSINNTRRNHVVTAHLQWEKAMAIWQQLYYCNRDDGVFVPGRNEFVPIEEMNNYLFR